MRRAGLVVLLLVSAGLSFGLAIVSAIKGRLPVVEMAHALLFSFVAMAVAAAPAQTGGCRECGQPGSPGFAFCTGCGRIARAASS